MIQISYDIIKVHGRKIFVGHNGLPWRIPFVRMDSYGGKLETKEGEGSTFIIQLPVKES